MKEKHSLKPKFSDSKTNKQTTLDNKYFDFFEYAPIALCIEDFSKGKAFVENAAKNSGMDVPKYLKNNVEIVSKLYKQIDIKEVNNTAVKLFKASSKQDLIKNLDRVFTPDSAIGFSKLIVNVLCGVKEACVETVNKTFEDDVINVLIKYKIQSGSEETLENVIISIEDITDRKYTEDLLFKSNQRLQYQFCNTPLASIIWDKDGDVIEWNNSAQRIFGYTIEEAKKEKQFFLVPEDITPEIRKINTELLKSKGKGETTNKNITKSGEIIICNWYNVTLKDTEGNVTGVASLVDDITERVNSKELIEKSEKKYRDIFEKSIDPVLIIKNSLFTDCNFSTLKAFGYLNKNELLQIHPSKISPKHQSDGMLSSEKADKMMQIALEKGYHRFRWNHKRRNGHVFPAEVTLTKIEEYNNISIHAVVVDISEKVKKEEVETILYNISKAALRLDDFNEFGYFIKNELNKIIDTTNFYIALYDEVTDSFFTPVMVDEMENITKFTAEGTLTGYIIKTQQPLLITSKTHAKLIESGEFDLFGIDSKIWLGVPLKTQDKVFGAIVVQSYTNSNAYNESDVQLLEFVADQISSSIHRKNTDNELKKALAKAQESDRLKSAFLANMSHEIRTPMNGIIGFSELFLDPNLSYSERKEYAKIVIKSSRRLLSIVNDILDISKIEAGVVQINNEPVNINNLLNDLENFYLPIAKEKNLLLRCNKGLKNSESTIKIDKTKLHQVLTNLLSNAFKFTHQGSIEFGYDLKNNKLQFYVKDTGVGIDKKLHHTIFDRFIQANVNFEKQGKGTGLGLAISKRFIELFKGEIWIASEKQGTTIYFTIPYKKTSKFIINSVTKEKPKNKPNNNNATILVAEDEEYNLLYISELFSKTNYKLLEAKTGAQAVDICQKNPEISLVLMDIKMPVMNGNEAMSKIKKIYPNLPIIALSAFAMESDKQNALTNGFDSYLSKPIEKELLFEVIEQFLK